MQHIDEAIMELKLIDATLDRLIHFSELSAGAIREGYELKNRLINARLILLEARENGGE